MKRIAILVSALFLAAPAIAQDKSTTREPSTNPNPNVQSDTTRSNSDAPAKTDSAVPTAEDRAKNRDAVSGATLTGKVKSALAADVGLSTVTTIDVDSDNGVVTLKGRVDSADKKAKAEEIAKKVDGVRSVKNELRVEKST